MGAEQITGKIAVSKAGVEALRELAKNLRANNESIKAACNSLQKTVGTLGEDIGIYKDDINERVTRIKAAQTKGEDDIEILVGKTEELAAKVEEMVQQLLN